jgi:hypothetical protein
VDRWQNEDLVNRTGKKISLRKDEAPEKYKGLRRYSFAG